MAPPRASLDDVDSEEDEGACETVSASRAAAPAAAPHALPAEHGAATMAERDKRQTAEFQRKLASRLGDMQQKVASVVADVKSKLDPAALAQITDEELNKMVADRVAYLQLLQTNREVGNAEKGVAPESYDDRRAERIFSGAVAEALDADGVAVVDGVVAGAELAALRGQLEGLRADGRLRVTVQKAAGARDDAIRWVTEREVGHLPEVAAGIHTLKGLALQINRRLGWDMTVPARCMLACYPGEEDPGARYVAHRDNSRNEDGAWSNRRHVTAILYANPEDWDPEEDGGCLRLHTGAPPGADKTLASDVEETGRWAYRDVVPEGGRLVLFKSKELLHEVLPAYRDRFALTIWLFQRDPELDTA